MQSPQFSRFLIFVFVLLALDLLAFRNLRAALPAQGFWWRQFPIWVYWFLSVAMYALFLYGLTQIKQFKPENYKPFYTLFGLIILLYVPKLVMILFQAGQDIINTFIWLANKLHPAEVQNGGAKISRGVFLSRMGLMLAAIPFVSILYGILYGRFNFKVITQKLTFPALPKEFDGFKIVQISDVHIGSFFDRFEDVDKGIEMVNALKPDLILFTGDLVNNYASETEGWHKVFNQLRAPYGKLAVLGNHDYCEYGVYENAEERLRNFEGVVAAFENLGFELLRNQNREIRKGDAQIDILGVENWGLPPFPQYGDLPKTLAQSKAEFKILMSHDPSHWDAEVLPHTDIPLTLSGHTHGMQFGVEIGNWKWSPVKYRYPRWAGLYSQGQQLLYVNRGFGYIGFPGRVGIMPEITLFELRSSA
jgi:predicted MPP superfamily phosphohydrolase